MNARETQRRVRNPETTQAVLNAALELAYSGGLQAVTVEKIVSITGIAKTTIYRRWPNAACILMEAFLNSVGPRIEYGANGRVDRIFEKTIKAFVKVLEGKTGMLLRHLLGSAQLDPDLEKAFSERWINPRRQMGIMALEAAVNRGELRREANHNLILDTIYGAIYYKLLFSFSSIDDDYIRELIHRTFADLLVNKDVSV